MSLGQILLPNRCLLVQPSQSVKYLTNAWKKEKKKGKQSLQSCYGLYKHADDTKCCIVVL